MDHGWNRKRRAFTQHDQTQVLDASLLMLALVGFVAPSDPMWRSTLDAMDGELVSDSLVYRHDPSASPDGLAGEDWRRCSPTPTTWACTPRRSGSPASSWATSPQAFTHLSLINAAITLNHQLDHAAGTDPIVGHAPA